MKRLFNYLISTTWGLYIIRLFLTEEQNKKLSIEMLRSNFSLFGYDLSDMTDQEIEDGMNKVSELMSSFGLTADEAANALDMTEQIKTI